MKLSKQRDHWENIASTQGLKNWQLEQRDGVWLPDRIIEDFLPEDLFRYNCLDFGGGAGRNLPALRDFFTEVDLYDLPKVVETCKAEYDSKFDILPDKMYDVVISSRVFQHIDSIEEVEHYVQWIQTHCRYFYLLSRCWTDRNHENVFERVLSLGNFTSVKTNKPIGQILNAEHPDKLHFHAMFEL